LRATGVGLVSVVGIRLPLAHDPWLIAGLFTDDANPRRGCAVCDGCLRIVSRNRALLKKTPAEDGPAP
jgi:hypothetical protein